MDEIKIFVKYCGGCNPTFNRKKVVKQIEKYFQTEIKPYKDDHAPDIVLIINGCKSECIDMSLYKSKYLTILINEQSQIKDVIITMKMIIDELGIGIT